jgi:hypothetical protein
VAGTSTIFHSQHGYKMLATQNVIVKLLTRKASVHYWKCEEDERAPPAVMLSAVWTPLVLSLHHAAQF